MQLVFQDPLAALDPRSSAIRAIRGQLAQIFNGDPLDNNALVNVQQAYISYLAPVGKGLTLDFGKFVTPVGFEPTESKDNNNYSR